MRGQWMSLKWSSVIWVYKGKTPSLRKGILKFRGFDFEVKASKAILHFETERPLSLKKKSTLRDKT